ncbi:MAG: Copper resistance protein K [Candidatus Accumulibacter phosphatis]|uniref:Copper resistance protein K n=1 Tax=Candidatus Accumulibacter phosphatis TaxID=327160 RepID=A0A080M1G0_9PROT|nr:MAG: Copper resistance protein K [Candidatus Accumulibacter phosphatis]
MVSAGPTGAVQSYLYQGKVMETTDGQKIIMHGDEVSRLSSLLNENHKGGS